MARGDIDEFRNPAFDREMAYLAQQAASANQGSRLGGLASMLMRGERGWRMGQDKRQRSATSAARTRGVADELKIIDAIKGVKGDPGVTERAAASDIPDAGALAGAYAIDPVQEVKAEMARIDPNSGPLVGQKRELAAELRLNPNNYSAQNALTAVSSQQAARASDLMNLKIARETKLGDRDEERRHAASLLKTEQQYKKELLQAAGPFVGKSSEMTYRRILQRASPDSKEYAVAYSDLAAPKVTVTPDGNTTTVTPDMSMYPPPTFQVGGGQTAPAVSSSSAIRSNEAPLGAPVVVPQLRPQPKRTVGQPTITRTGRVLPRLTPAEKKVDVAFAKDYAEAFIGGKAADTQKQINQLGVSIELLKGSDNITGPVISALPDALRERFYPASADAQEKVAEVTQRNLKAVLGGQFSEREGDRLIARAYNLRLEEAYNIQRVTALRDAIQKAFDAKVAAAQYYEGEGNGSLQGYKGAKFWSMADIEAHALGPAGVSEEDIQETMRANAMSRRSVIDKLNGVTP